MGKLQSDLTTPEQSKRLLELGVPKITANYYYDSRDFKPQAHEVRGHWNEEEDQAFRHGYKITPLWSVGQLIWIAHKCADMEYVDKPYICLYKGENYINVLMSIFEKYADIYMDFSKLED